MPLLTVFTPAYNRAYVLPQLYKSLCRQTCRDFEWLVVDDGSTDGTADLVRGYIAEGRVDIRLIVQPNGGKHRAINRGVAEARGELFFIVDSDDFLLPNAVDWIIRKSNEIIDVKSFAGISGLRVDPDGHKIGGDSNFHEIDSDAISIRTVHHVNGDLAEIYKTEILRRFPFPDIDGEKFCSEGLIWNRIAMNGFKLRYCYEPLYVCEYLDDGLTAGRNKCRYDSPEYSMTLYAELIKNPTIRPIEVVKYAIRFWQFSFKSKRTIGQKIKLIGGRHLIFYPFGLIFKLMNK